MPDHPVHKNRPSESVRFARLVSVSRILSGLSLAYVVGGTLVLGALVAPAVFHALPRETAGRIMGGIFQRYDTGLAVSAVVLLVMQVLQWIFGREMQSRGRFWLQTVLSLSLVTSIGLSVFVLDPQIAALQKAGIRRDVGVAGQRFDTLHHQSEQVYKLNLLLGAGLLAVLLL